MSAFDRIEKRISSGQKYYYQKMCDITYLKLMGKSPKKIKRIKGHKHRNPK